MRIGVVSDTHNNLKNCHRIVEIFNSIDLDRIVHTGDITQAKTMEVFSRLATPMVGVYGNNDLEREDLVAAAAQFQFEFVDPPLTLSWAGRRVVIVHDPLELDQVSSDDYDLILHGHTHRKTLERTLNQLTFNPGECAGMMPGMNAVGLVDLRDLSAEIINF